MPAGVVVATLRDPPPNPEDVEWNCRQQRSDGPARWSVRREDGGEKRRIGCAKRVRMWREEAAGTAVVGKLVGRRWWASWVSLAGNVSCFFFCFFFFSDWCGSV